MSIDNPTQQLVSKQEITELIYTYCRSVDRLDISLGHSIWCAGANIGLNGVAEALANISSPNAAIRTVVDPRKL